MEIRKEILDAYRYAIEQAADVMSEFCATIVTIFDEEDEPWAEIRLTFFDGTPKEINVYCGNSDATRDWVNDQQALEYMENVVSDIQNFIRVRMNWLGY